MIKPQDGLQRMMSECGIRASSDAGMKLLRYLTLLEKWNQKINLTARCDWESLQALFHEGIWAAGKYSAKFTRHLDIGSGAGFPGMILNIFYPDTRMEMVESRGKKSAFLETAAFSLSLKNVCVHALRLDALLSKSSPDMAWDCISWKAIRIADCDLAELKRHMHQETELWMFHGKEDAVEKPETLQHSFHLKEQHRIPRSADSFLSIYTI